MSGILEVGVDPKTHEVVINHPDLQPDANGCGHIVFSVSQALDLAMILMKKAAEAQTSRGLDPSDDDFEIKRIEVDFAIPVVMTPMIQRQLDEIVSRMARATETDEIVHWASGCGSKPIWNEPNEPTFDDSVYHIETCARQRYESERKS
ncbi:MAG TPA: hypothetical protein VMW38_25030 [Terriglobia bacterium]|nr:hypothetical protein [Terriglobia bacterium]